MIFFAILSTKRQKTFNDGGRQTTIKKVHTGGNGKKNCLQRSTDQKGTAEETFLHPDDLFSILSPILSYPILSYPFPFLSLPFLSFPFLSFPFPTRSSFPVPLPILSPVPFSVPFSVPFRLDLHSYPHPSGIFFDLIPALTPFCAPLIARRFEVNRFLQKNNF